MNQARKITHHIFSLIRDILLLGYRVIRQVILPSRKRKGNLLSSIFILMMGVLDRLVIFERNIIPAPVLFPMIFRNRYVRQGLQIAFAVFLFITSFEWSAGRIPFSNSTGLYTECPATGKKVDARAEKAYLVSSVLVKTDSHIYPYREISPVHPYRLNPPPVLKKYLFVRNLRI